MCTSKLERSQAARARAFPQKSQVLFANEGSLIAAFTLSQNALKTLLAPSCSLYSVQSTAFPAQIALEHT